MRWRLLVSPSPLVVVRRVARSTGRQISSATSRHLARTRQSVRAAVERELRDDAGLADAQIAECLASVAADPGPLDLQPLFAAGDVKPERSA